MAAMGPELLPGMIVVPCGDASGGQYIDCGKAGCPHTAGCVVGVAVNGDAGTEKRIKGVMM